jgi:predicted nucleic acid-binding protein
MTQVQTVILDNEAVQALAEVAHRKHRRALALVEAIAARNVRRSGSVRLLVPTTVRVEAGWDRRARRAAAINRLRVTDAPLDTGAADRSSRIREAVSVSVADAHMAAVLQTTAGPHTVVTSDADDVTRLGRHLDIDLNLVRI